MKHGPTNSRCCLPNVMCLESFPKVTSGDVMRTSLKRLNVSCLAKDDPLTIIH